MRLQITREHSFWGLALHAIFRHILYMTITGYKRLTIVLVGVVVALLILSFNLGLASSEWKNRELTAWVTVHGYARDRDSVVRS